MGLPISRFEQLCNLCDENNSYTRREFSKFTLTAIILHEADDERFKFELQNNFMHLDRITGDRFLFISFVEPSQFAIQMCHDRWNISSLNMSADSIMDNEESLQKLKRHFRLDDVDMPVILLTNNMAGNKFYVIKTHTNMIFNVRFPDVYSAFDFILRNNMEKMNELKRLLGARRDVD